MPKADFLPSSELIEVVAVAIEAQDRIVFALYAPRLQKFLADTYRVMYARHWQSNVKKAVYWQTPEKAEQWVSGKFDNVRLALYATEQTPSPEIGK